MWQKLLLLKLYLVLWKVNKTRAYFSLSPLPEMPKGKGGNIKCPLKIALEECGVTRVLKHSIHAKDRNTAERLCSFWGKKHAGFSEYKIRTPWLFRSFILSIDREVSI